MEIVKNSAASNFNDYAAIECICRAKRFGSSATCTKSFGEEASDSPKALGTVVSQSNEAVNQQLNLTTRLL